MNLKAHFIPIIFILSLMLFSCGGEKKAEATEESSDMAVVSESRAAANRVNPGDTVKIVVNSTDQMQYDINEIKAYEGTIVELTLNHTGQMAIEVMGHNLVILKPGVEVADYASRSFGARDNDYIPEGDEAIAYTTMLGGGESSTIIFDAPSKGTYDFICSFPGHYGVMNGKFIVE
ncbi:MAG: plastocyanin/azurin family copper-binding protein [Bacteroidota bacterium]